MPEPRVLLLDIETAPARGWFWGGSKFEQDIIEIDQDWFILSVAWKWLGEKRAYVRGLCDYPEYKKPKNRCRDFYLMRDVWKLLDDADVVVAHNGKKFDLRKINTRFFAAKMNPPSPYKIFDTLTSARKEAGFTSNSKDDLCQFFGVGRKLPHMGKKTWFGAMNGHKGDWALLKRYNHHDVDPLLEGIYLRLRPWATNHPNLSHISRADACPVCQSSDLKRSGWNYVATGRKQRSTCLDCGHRFVSGRIERV